MREMLAVTSAIAGGGMIADVALITDGRFSGGSHGIVVGHIAPEAQAGGPIAAIEEGDTITIEYARLVESASRGRSPTKPAVRARPTPATSFSFFGGPTEVRPIEVWHGRRLAGPDGPADPASGRRPA